MACLCYRIPQAFHIYDDILVIIVRFAKDRPIPKSEQ
jgi:hypothetical protein